MHTKRVIEEGQAATYNNSTSVESRRGDAGYLAAIRKSSAYSAYRSLTGFIAFLGWIFSTIVALSSIPMFEESDLFPGLFFLVGGAFGFVIVTAFYQFSLMLADIADSLIEQGSR